MVNGNATTDSDKDPTAEGKDPEEKALRRVFCELQVGNFKRARLVLQEMLHAATGETNQELATIQKNLKPDPAALVVASVCAAALITTALLTLFH